MSDQRAAAGVIRLIFAYEGAEVRLVSRERVRMLRPPQDPPTRDGGEAGFWVEMRGPDEAPLYRQVLHEAVRPDTEVFSDDPRETIARTAPRSPSGLFTVLVPDLAEAEQLVLMGNPPGRRGPRDAATELLRVPLGPDEGGAS